MADLHAEHTPAAIENRLQERTRHSYLRDGVLGAIDGTVTTFAIVAASSGAGLSHGVALVLGLSNVLADGFSMAAGNYLGAKADRQVVDRARQIEEHHVETVPDGEREEIRQLFAAKGFAGPVLEDVVEVITQDRERWVDTMLTEELGHRLDNPDPLRAAATTFVAFLAAGLVPLFALMLFGQGGFGPAATAAALSFVVIGWIKGALVNHSPLRSAVETLLIGGFAASLAWGVAAAIKDVAVG